jgi:hypothetical protein
MLNTFPYEPDNEAFRFGRNHTFIFSWHRLFTLLPASLEQHDGAVLIDRDSFAFDGILQEPWFTVLGTEFPGLIPLLASSPSFGMANANIHMIYILTYLRKMLLRALHTRSLVYLENRIGTQLVPGMTEYMQSQEHRLATGHRPWSRRLDIAAACIITAIVCPEPKSTPSILESDSKTPYRPQSITIRNGRGSYYLFVQFTKEEGSRRILPCIGDVEDEIHHQTHDIHTKPRRMLLIRDNAFNYWHEVGSPRVFYNAPPIIGNVPRLWTLAMAKILGNWLHALRDTRNWINQQLAAMAMLYKTMPDTTKRSAEEMGGASPNDRRPKRLKMGREVNLNE